MKISIRFFLNYNSFKRIYGENNLAENLFYPTFGLIFLKEDDIKKFDKLLYFFKNTIYEKISILSENRIILFGDLNLINNFSEELKIVEKEIAFRISFLLSNYVKSENYNYKIGEKFFTSQNKYVMAILNVTDDSFYDGGKYLNISEIKEIINKFIDAGVDIIDIGGESTRPGSEPISATDELKRIMPAVEYALSKKMIVSVDTYKSDVAKECLRTGVQIINDISGFKFDPQMADLCSNFNATSILMHIRGTPKTMQNNPYYQDTMADICEELEQSIEIAISKNLKQIYIDPGIGFGKRVFDNYEILNRLEEIKFLGYPILIGLSRKSFIGKLLNQQPDERLTGTITANSISLIKAANIIRVHDYKEAIETKKIIEAIINPDSTF